MRYIGLFSPMLAFMIIAFIRARRGKLPWIWYGVGACIELVALIGLARKFSGGTGKLWGIYIAILFFAAIIIFVFGTKSKTETVENDKETGTLYHRPSQANISSGTAPLPQNRGKEWTCKQCGMVNPENYFICKCGNKKSENDTIETG